MGNCADVNNLLERWKEFLTTRLGAVEGESFLEVLFKIGPEEAIRRRPELAKMVEDQDFLGLSRITPESLKTMSDAEYIETFEPIARYWGWGILVQDHVVIMDALLNHLQGPTTILDIGCGPCSALIFLKREGVLKAKLVAGIDPSPGILGQAKRISAEEGVEVSLFRGWAKALPFRSGSFEQVISIDTLHWTEAWREALAEMARVTRDGGRIFISYTLFSPRRQIPALEAVSVLTGNGIDIQGVTHFTAEKSLSPRVFINGIKQKSSPLIIVPSTTDYTL